MLRFRLALCIGIIMGRYDGPDFECEDRDVVSIWIAKCSSDDIPNDYFEENYSGDDDEPFNQFSTDFGFGYYDHDFVEAMALGGSSPLEEILNCSSYGESFAKKATLSSETKETVHVFLMYNFEYKPEVTGIIESNFYKFIGVYDYDRNE